MDLNLSEDQQALQEAFGDLFGKESTPSRVRAAEPLGFDAALWRTVVETGVVDGDASLSELVVVLKEAGRRLAGAPIAEAVVAKRLGVTAALPTLALNPPVGGIARLVPAGAVADAVVVLDGDRLLLQRIASVGEEAVPPGKEAVPHGEEVAPYGLAAPYRVTAPREEAAPNLGCVPLADVTVTRGAQVLVRGPAARARHERAVTEWKLLTAAALDGLREEALRLGVEYVKERHAFGVPIGWFQSVGHRLADLVTAGEGGTLLLHNAAWALDTGSAEGPELASMAFLHLADVAFRSARASLQFHGGYGYTLEYDIQLYLRRAKSWPLVLGPRRCELRRLATLAFDRDGR